MYFDVYKYSYSKLAKLPSICKHILKNIQRGTLVLVEGHHFHEPHDLLPQRMCEQMAKKPVKLAIEIFPSSFYQASPAERKQLYDYLSTRRYSSGRFPQLEELANTEIYGLRTLRYPESRGLAHDFEECWQYFNQLSPAEVDAKLIAEIRNVKPDIVLLGYQHLEPIYQQLSKEQDCVRVFHQCAVCDMPYYQPQAEFLVVDPCA